MFPAKTNFHDFIFSVMQPGTVVWPHTGPTNARLRLHLGLVVPEDYKNVNLTVAEQTRYWEEGKVLTFDDSFEHSVMHHGEHYRDIWFYTLTIIVSINSITPKV